MNLYENIKKRREELNMTQEELAKCLGYSGKSTISRIESGKNELNQSKIAKFAKALKTTPADLLGIVTGETQDKTAEVDPPKVTVIYKDSDYTLTSGTRRMKDGAADFLHGTLDTMTEPRDDDYSSSTSSIPSRDEIFDWLNTYWLMAADDGTNIERYTDEELLDYYYAAREAYEEEMEKDR